MGRVEGKVALVTGGAKGLGLASARALVAEGARVMITDVDATSGEAAARELGANVVFRHQDVTDKNSWDATLDDVVARFGSINILVNSAGVGSFFSVEEISDVAHPGVSRASKSKRRKRICVRSRAALKSQQRR